MSKANIMSDFAVRHFPYLS